jgi:hypothetical protein
MASAVGKQKSKGPVLKPISEQMREWSAMLQAEVETWPAVSAKKMFGMISLYRRKQIFAALPYTRTLGAADSFMFKFEKPTAKILAQLSFDKRIIAEQGIGTRWFIFRIGSPADLHPAIEWLAHAYEAARGSKN